jgi:hypothetical protein
MISDWLLGIGIVILIMIVSAITGFLLAAWDLAEWPFGKRRWMR